MSTTDQATIQPLSTNRRARHNLLSRFGHIVASVYRLVIVRRRRNHLGDLGAYQLRDIGLGNERYDANDHGPVERQNDLHNLDRSLLFTLMRRGL